MQHFDAPLFETDSLNCFWEMFTEFHIVTALSKREKEKERKFDIVIIWETWRQEYLTNFKIPFCQTIEKS